MNIEYRSKLSNVVDDIGFTSIRYIDLTLPGLNFNTFIIPSSAENPMQFIIYIHNFNNILQE